MARRSLALLVALLAGCPSPPAQPSQYPPRPEGCYITIFTTIPPMQTDNIGPVSATCAENVTDADCLRTLKDQACKLGADVIWGIDEGNKLGKKYLSGRSAHTKAGAK